MRATPLSMYQKAMIEQIKTFTWRRLDRLRISPTHPTLVSLIRRGIVQKRSYANGTEVHTYEVRLVSTPATDGRLREAALALINAIPPVTRKLLSKQIADVLAHIVNEEKQR
jgi:hypothetical protein